MRFFSSFKQRMIFSALLPGLLTVMLLGLGVGGLLYQDVHQRQQEDQQAALRLMAELAATPLQQSSTPALETLAHQLLNLPSLRSIAFYQPDLTLITRAGLPAPAGQTTVRVMQPVYQANITPPVLAGWAELYFSTSSGSLALYKAGIVVLAVLFLVITAGTVLTLFLFRHSTRSLSQLAQELAQIRDGEKTTPLSPADTDEGKILVEAFNKTVGKLQQQIHELQESITSSSQDLRETLEAMEIQSIELDLARKEALQASRMKSEFLANTSHEIRTPLNGIMGFTRLLQRSCTDPLQQEHLATIQRSSESLLGIINDILDLSRIEAGKLVLDYSPFNLFQLTEETLHLLTPSAQEKGLELAFNADSNVPAYFCGDPLRLRQILTNLVGNAIKFSNVGSILVRFAVLARHDNHLTLKCSVTDSGTGQPRSPLSRDLFSAFTRGENSVHREGVGLGLAISQKLTLQMGGDIGVENEASGGATFWFTVKLDVHAQTTAHPSPRPALPTQPLIATPDNARMDANRHKYILVVDDNADNLKLLSYLLHELGYTVREASTGHDAIALCQQQIFDLILMDIRMPGLDGVETTRRIRTLHNANRKTPVIAVTAHALADQKSQFLLAGMNDYLSKPIDETSLLRILLRWTGGRRSPDAEETLIPIERCVDTAQCLRACHGRADIAADMLTRLISELREYQRSTHVALGEARYHDALEYVHKLHGATCYSGVPQLKAACLQLETELLGTPSMPPADVVSRFDHAIDGLLSWREEHDIATLFSLGVH